MDTYNKQYPFVNKTAVQLIAKDADGNDVLLTVDAQGQLKIVGTISIDTSSVATSSNQTNGNQLTKITDGAGTVTTKQLGTQVTTSDVGLVTNSVIHGKTTAGGSTFVDVKVNPSGALSVDAGLSQPLTDAQLRATPVPISGSLSIDTTGLATEAKQDTGNTSLSTIAGAVSGTEMQVDVLTMPTTTVQATNLDIRDLTSASDSIAAVQSGTWNLNNISGTVSLPTGAATESTLGTLNGKIPSNLTVTATRLLVDGSGVTQPISGTITANLAAGTNNIGDVDVLSLPSLPSGSNSIGVLGSNSGIDIGDVTINNGAGIAAVNIQDGGNTITVDGTVTANISGSISNTAFGVNNGSGASAVNIQDGGNAITVDNGGTFAVQETTYSTSSVTSVAASASSVQLLASTAGRRGAYFYNDSSAICYLKLGTTASTSSFTIAMAASSFYELPYPCYTGRIDAIWASATGNMRITEIS